jgi:hypothetical protein
MNATWHRHNSFWVGIVLWVCVGIPFGVHGEWRTWTSATGEEVRARYAGVESGLVVLDLETESQVAIRLDALSAADQEWVQQRQKAEAEAVDPARLPVLRQVPGDLRRVHAHYTHAHFVAYVCDRGFLYVHPTDNGELQGRRIEFAKPVLLQKTGAEHISQRVSHIVDHSPPALNPRTVWYIAETETEERVRYRVEYTFEGNAVSVLAEVVEPLRPSLSTMLRVNTSFPASYDIPATMLLPEIKRVVEGASLRYERRGASAVEHTFHESLRLGASVDAVTIKGPWRARTIRLDADNRKAGNTLRLYNYGGKPLYEGYALFRQVDAGARTGPYTIRIE